MDRKKFIQKTGIGLGFVMVPGIALSQDQRNSITISTELKPKIVKKSDGEVLNVIGDIQTHKILGKDTDNQIVEWTNNVQPGVGIPPHIHTMEDEIFRVLKGQIEIMVNGKVTILSAGDFAFAPRNLVHAWKVVGTEEASMLTSAFPAGIEHMFQELATLPEGPPNFEKIAAICVKRGISFV